MWEETFIPAAVRIDKEGSTMVNGNLGTYYSQLAKQWHLTKNGDLTPYDVTPTSNKKVWWICDVGHEYEATVRSRCNGLGCPYDSGKIWPYPFTNR